jgi:23S rRNA U2552 (ribose-2'-O)-methylase RlmE/FtsJ
MIYFLIPKTHLFTYTKLNYQESHSEPCVFISPSLSYYLSNIKEKINVHEKDWDIYKKYTNPYEYIHTLIPNKKKSVSKNKPLSRSYFKMIEILHIFKPMKILNRCGLESQESDISDNLEQAPNSGCGLISLRNLQQYNHDGCPVPNPMMSSIGNDPRYLLKPTYVPIKTFHLCEGPGGFIQAVVEMRKNPHDTYTGMTILDDHDNYDIPAWKKSDAFLKENPNVGIETGLDGTGDILKVENFMYCKAKYASSMDLVTGDGGFDFSMDFNNQEVNISQLLFAQIAYALCLQKVGGSFVLKIFDCFMYSTVDLLYLLSSFYEKVYITKPQTSRYANSEKYVVCKNFLFSSCEEFYPFLLDVFQKMVSTEENHPERFLSIAISNHFLTKMEEFNSIFGQQQIENIYYTISLIETKNKAEKIDHLVKNNVQKCVGWCMKYGVGYNQITNANVFLSGGNI